MRCPPGLVARLERRIDRTDRRQIVVAEHGIGSRSQASATPASPEIRLCRPTLPPAHHNNEVLRSRQLLSVKAFRKPRNLSNEGIVSCLQDLGESGSSRFDQMLVHLFPRSTDCGVFETPDGERRLPAPENFIVVRERVEESGDKVGFQAMQELLKLRSRPMPCSATTI